VTAEPLVLTVFGAEWRELVPLLLILSPVGLVQTLNNPTGWIYQSQGRTDWMFRWGLFGSGTLVLALLIGVYLGSIETVAWAYLIANVLLLYPCIFFPGKLIGMTVSEVIRVSLGNLACALAMALITSFIGQSLPSPWPVSLHLAIQVFSGFAIYSGLSVLFNLKAYQEVKAMYRERL
jgi:PST family polysaccharide transporter